MKTRTMSVELESARRIIRTIDRFEANLDEPTKRFLLDKLICRGAPDGGVLANVEIIRKPASGKR